jgi:hypothetical protein
MIIIITLSLSVLMLMLLLPKVFGNYVSMYDPTIKDHREGKWEPFNRPLQRTLIYVIDSISTQLSFF